MGFLDNEGLRHFWQKIKTKIEDASKTGGVEVGTIVNIDKDATIPEGYEEVTDEDEIVQVTDKSEIITPATGFSILDGTIFRNKNRYFGNVTIKKDSGNFTSTAEIVANFSKKVIGNRNTGCFLCSGQWTVVTVGYCYISTTTIQVTNNTGENYYGVAKINFDLVTDEESTTKPIKKVAVTELDPITGSIVDGTNIDDKATNTYSANVIDGFNTHSTEEQVVGTYLGKNLYRITKSTTKANLLSELNAIKNINVIHFEGFMLATNGAKMQVFNSFSATGYNWNLYIDNGGNVNGEFGSNFSDSSATEVTMYYTKTTS